MLAALATLLLVVGGVATCSRAAIRDRERAKGSIRAALIGYELAPLAPVLVSIVQQIVGEVSRRTRVAMAAAPPAATIVPVTHARRRVRLARFASLLALVALPFGSGTTAGATAAPSMKGAIVVVAADIDPA